MRGEGGSGLERPAGQPEERLLPTCPRGVECMGDRVNAEGGCLSFCTSCGVLIARFVQLRAGVLGGVLSANLPKPLERPCRCHTGWLV